MVITVNVTQEDIDSGDRCKSRSCPVARAILRSVKGAAAVSVGTTTAAFRTKRFFGLLPMADYGFALPRAVRDFISNYDYQGTGEPFSFTVEATKAGS